MKIFFDRFKNFGLIADHDTRTALADTIFLHLCGNGVLSDEKRDNVIGLSNKQTNNFAEAIDAILSGNETMHELCSADNGLAEQVTQNILDFVNTTRKEIQKTENPYEEERRLLDEFKKCQAINFEGMWDKTSSFIQKTYLFDSFDTNFYHDEFQKSLALENKKEKKEDGNNEKNAPKKNNKKINFQSVKEHFTDKWEKLLFEKQTKWELELIDKAREKFCEELYKRIEELKMLQELVEPFVGKISGLWGMGMMNGSGASGGGAGGRLWGMGKGSWQRANFDILKRYAELLQKDKSLHELAEMLGRMQSAEIEYEEEIFTDTIIKPEWKIEHAGKSDLVGIRESDDISSMLPSEAAYLADPMLETVFYKKFAEKKLQTFNYHAKVLSSKEETFQNKRQKSKEDKKGPIIVCVDTSGSMSGTPEQVAKTLSFALLKIAIRDNRKCYLISFSTRIETLELTDMRNSLEKLLGFLSMCFHGGTDARPALNEAVRMLQSEDYKKADVVMVSDFVMSGLDENMQATIQKAKENKTKFHSLVIGSSGNQKAIDEFDSNWIYDPRDSERAIKQLVKDVRNGIV